MPFVNFFKKKVDERKDAATGCAHVPATRLSLEVLAAKNKPRPATAKRLAGVIGLLLCFWPCG
jgi:hypothetical protein